jgi:hypothetical protein
LEELRRLNPPSHRKLLSQQELHDYEEEFDRIEAFETAENQRLFDDVTLSLNAREDSKWYFVSILYFNWSNDLVQPVGETGFRYTR